MTEHEYKAKLAEYAQDSADIAWKRKNDPRLSEASRAAYMNEAHRAHRENEAKK